MIPPQIIVLYSFMTALMFAAGLQQTMKLVARLF